MDFTDPNSSLRKHNREFSTLWTMASSRPDLAAEPDGYLNNLKRERRKGAHFDTPTVLDNIDKFKHSLDKVNVDDVKASADSMASLLDELKDRANKIGNNITMDIDTSVAKEQLLNAQSIAVMNQMSKEGTLLYDKSHAQYLDAFGSLLNGDPGKAHEQFVALSHAHSGQNCRHR